MQDAAAFNCSALAVPIFCLLSCARVSEKTGSKSMGEENWRRISFEVLTKIPEKMDWYSGETWSSTQTTSRFKSLMDSSRKERIDGEPVVASSFHTHFKIGEVLRIRSEFDWQGISPIQSIGKGKNFEYYFSGIVPHGNNIQLIRGKLIREMDQSFKYGQSRSRRQRSSSQSNKTIISYQIGDVKKRV